LFPVIESAYNARMSPREPSPPPVVLVGAGPGEADLVTRAGAGWLKQANCVVYDRLVDPALLGLAPDAAERVYVGKSPGEPGMSQQDINALLVARARAGRRVVRLKGGDPLVFGRGGEEAEALAAAGIPFVIVPGVTAASAAAAGAGIPLTHRGLSSAVALVTGHEDPDKGESAVDFAALARLETVVFYMGVGKLASLAERLMAAGRSGETPAAVVERAATPDQRTVTATLATLAEQAEETGIAAPAVIIVGPTVALREKLAWLEALPLFGRTVLVTRPRGQAEALRAGLAARGAAVVLAPAVEVRPPDSTDALDAALRRLGETDWLVLTSANGVEQVFARLHAAGRDARALGGVRVAAVGPATADALRRHGIEPDLVPEAYTTGHLGRALAATGDLGGWRVLLARSASAGPEPAASLTAAGARVEDVPAYRTGTPETLPEPALEALRAGRADWIAFTTPSTVERLFELSSAAGATDAVQRAKAAAIGPVTADALRARGLEPAVVAAEHTAGGLVDAIVAAERGR
jgi:uroporphyrinogen III methyltransferase/synthase